MTTYSLPSSGFHDLVFRKDVETAMKSVRKVLDNDKSSKLRLAESVDHTYSDKYKLAELLTNTSIVALMKVLQELGLTREILLQSLQEEEEEGGEEGDSNSKSKMKRSKTLRFEASESCVFEREEVVDVPSSSFTKETETETTTHYESSQTKTKNETKTEANQDDDFGFTTTNNDIQNPSIETNDSNNNSNSNRNSKSTTITQIVHRVIKQHYTIQTKWEISLYSGNDVQHKRILQTRTATFPFVQSTPLYGSRSKSMSPKAPFPPHQEISPSEVSLTWLFQQIDAAPDKSCSHFCIDLQDSANKTPRRNPQIEAALSSMQDFQSWTNRVAAWFLKSSMQYDDCESRGVYALSADDEETASHYRKMIRMGMPDGAVIQKMSVDGVPSHIQDTVLAGDEPPKAAGESRIGSALSRTVRDTQIFVPILPLFRDDDDNDDNEKEGGTNGDEAMNDNEETNENEDMSSPSESWTEGLDAFETETETKTETKTELQANSRALVELGSRTLSLSGDTAMTTQQSDQARSQHKQAVVSVADTTTFLNEHSRTMETVKNQLSKTFPNNGNQKEPITVQEAMVVILCRHSVRLTQMFFQSVNYIEHLLEQQLVAAVGKRVQRSDLDKFVRYHNEQLFAPNTTPQRFCYTIRRPERYPDGILSIVEENSDVESYRCRDSSREKSEAISTHVRAVPALEADPVEVPLNAATSLALRGTVYIHGWLNHRFGTAPRSFQLSARARQFSSFVLLVGTMTSNNKLQPKDAIILRNKDEVIIPLLLNEIPTATEFKTSIGSLSPEQQRFASSFRSMQLDSSILGVCVIQIKPQLEKLLGLPKDSLSKEMKLTEDLTELFVKYQIPSDLLSCDCGDDSTARERVTNVKEHVASVLDVIASQKKQQLEEEAEKADMALEQNLSGEVYIRADGTKVRRMKKMGRSMMELGSAPLHRPNPCVPPSLNCMGMERMCFGSAAPSPRAAVESEPVSRSMPMFAGASETTDRGSAPPQRPNPRFQYPLCYDAIDQGAATTLQNAVAFDSADSSGWDGKESTNRESTRLSSDEMSQDSTGHTSMEETKPPSDVVDIANIPKLLDRNIELHDKNTALRSTTVETTNSGWTLIRQENLLSESKSRILGTDEIGSEKSRAFDLLDALSRSGSLEIPFSELHVLICATQEFEKTVMETVIQDNINPIEKIEVSTLLMASTILGLPPKDLVRSGTDRKRLEKSFPMLLHDAKRPKTTNGDDNGNY